MLAGWYERNGPASEVLEIGEMPAPAPGRDEVRVRIAFSGVNPSDVKRRDGWRGQMMAYPRVVPQMDGAGIIEGVGPGVDPARVGERVWLHSTAWKRPFGTAAEQAVLPSEHATRLPDGTSLAEGACLGVPAMTAHRAVFADGPVEGQTVLVTGGAGAVGFYAVQLAKWGGARVIATVSSPAKAEVARSAGADAVVDYKHEDAAERILALTEGAGVDRIVEVDFGANMPVTLRVLKPGGSIATYASMAQPEPVLPFYAFMNRNAVLRWVFVYDMPASAMRAAYADITRWLESGRARHLIAARFPLRDLVHAHQAVEAGTAVGNVIVEVAGE